MPNLVDVTYGRTGESVAIDRLGMREMQARAFAAREVFVATMGGADFRLGIRVFRLQVDHQHALRHADLDRGEPDPIGVIHRLEHVGDERLQFLVEGLDGRGNGLQPGVRHFEDFADGHAAQISTTAPNDK